MKPPPEPIDNQDTKANQQPPKQLDSPTISHHFNFVLRAHREYGDGSITTASARRYLNSFPLYIDKIQRQLANNKPVESTRVARALQSLCAPLAHPVMNVLCQQLVEIITSETTDTSRSILMLIKHEHVRIRDELKDFITGEDLGENPDAAMTIIIVSDDRTIQAPLEKQLTEAGFLAVFEQESNLVLSTLAKGLPAAVLVDINETAREGIQLCRQIRQLPGTDHLPILMAAGDRDSHSIEMAYDAGATDFIRKPFHWPILVLRLRYLLRSAKAFKGLISTQKRLSEAQRVAHIGHWDHNLVTNELLFSDELYDVIGHPTGAFSRFDEILAFANEDEHTTLKEAFCYRQRAHVCECSIRSITGDNRIIRIKSSPLHNADHEPMWVSGMIQDVTDQRRDQEIIRRLAYHDELTGLFNRTAFNREMEQALKLHSRIQRPLAIAFMDLDGFKIINDSLGHYAGDQLLKGFARRLTASLRTSDLVTREVSSTLARLGGDEFTLMLSGLQHKKDAAVVTQRILDSLKQPFLINTGSTVEQCELEEVYITASIGIAIYPDDGTTLIELQKNADKAMYMAKNTGKNAFHYYQKTMDGNAHARLNIETLLRKAIDTGELYLTYQPQMEVTSGRMIAVEALLRWQSAELGPMLPGDFIPIAEESGLIVPIGSWVLRQVCRQLKEWQSHGLDDFRVAVNLSGLQFHQPDFVELVTSIIDEFDIDPRDLELELTESLLMTEIESAITSMQQLKELGLTLSVDDFGTGYSSLSYLDRFPIDTLKIDRSFVSRLDDTDQKDALTKTIIAMAKNLNLQLVAEGVETTKQLEFLTEHQCEVIQGFLYSKPLLPVELETFHRQSLAQQAPRRASNN
ncbi:MAG: EAL domain-containing protein [Immundisolibacteraceae bacterium]|nr:EAL domain-containing protein [Immundisolibacteraceae bacterium]